MWIWNIIRNVRLCTHTLNHVQLFKPLFNFRPKYYILHCPPHKPQSTESYHHPVPTCQNSSARPPSNLLHDWSESNIYRRRLEAVINVTVLELFIRVYLTRTSLSSYQDWLVSSSRGYDCHLLRIDQCLLHCSLNRVRMTRRGSDEQKKYSRHLSSTQIPAGTTTFWASKNGLRLNRAAEEAFDNGQIITAPHNESHDGHIWELKNCKVPISRRKQRTNIDPCDLVRCLFKDHGIRAFAPEVRTAFETYLNEERASARTLMNATKRAQYLHFLANPEQKIAEKDKIEKARLIPRNAGLVRNIVLIQEGNFCMWLRKKEIFQSPRPLCMMPLTISTMVTRRHFNGWKGKYLAFQELRSGGYWSIAKCVCSMYNRIPRVLSFNLMLFETY